MSLPKQVQDQIARSAQIVADMGLDPSAPVTAPVSDPAQHAEPAQQVDPAQHVDPAQATQPAAQNDNWETKYKILQGKYNKEVPQLAAQVRDQEESLRQMQDQLSALSAAPRQEMQISGVSGDLDPKLRDEYGEEFFAIVAQTAARALQPTLSSMAQQMEELRRGLIGTQSSVQKTEHQIFLEQLDSQFKTWRTLNKDEGFNSWLAERDPFAGTPRKHLLDDAVRNRDVSRAIAFFEGYQLEHGKEAPSSQARTKAPDTSLAALAAPGASRPGTSPAPATFADEIWTGAEIKAFYNDVRLGKFRGRDAEKLAIEQRIATAAHQGRVRG